MWIKILVNFVFIQFVKTQFHYGPPFPAPVPPSGPYYPYEPVIADVPYYETHPLPVVQPVPPGYRQQVIEFLACRILWDPVCPDPNTNFYLFTQKNPETPMKIDTGSEWSSNLTKTDFDPKLPTKIIIHGYNSDKELTALVEVRKEYLKTKNYNIFAVDWGPLAMAPCYPGAVYNARHVGTCTAQLVRRIVGAGATDIHVIGFSLGAQVTNYMAVELRPYKVPRITGLDPALPGFVTLNLDEKLDPSDAHYVDVYHTNAFVQGKVENSGHVDFYINGGVVQPGCWAENRFFACNHHRAPLYFAESINTEKGFWGWPCPSFFQYLVGQCPIVEPQIIMGEYVDKAINGTYLVITESVSPYAVGKYTGPSIEIYLRTSEKNRLNVLKKYKKEVMQYIDEDHLADGVFVSRKIKAQLNRDFADEVFEYF